MSATSMVRAGMEARRSSSIHEGLSLLQQPHSAEPRWLACRSRQREILGAFGQHGLEVARKHCRIGLRSMDKVSRETRSKIMASVKPFGNKTTEMAMSVLLRENELLGYRKHWPIAGKPDFAWPKIKTALFVDGCFWHGCPRCKRVPSSNKKFWERRIAGNRRRDRRVSRALRKDGWAVIRVWECSLTKRGTIQRIRALVAGRRDRLPLGPGLPALGH